MEREKSEKNNSANEQSEEGQLRKHIFGKRSIPKMNDLEKDNSEQENLKKDNSEKEHLKRGNSENLNNVKMMLPEMTNLVKDKYEHGKIETGQFRNGTI